MARHPAAISLAALLALAIAPPGAARGEVLPRGEQRPAASRRTPVVDAVERTRAAVVNVSAEELVRMRVPSGNGELGSLFDEFFDRPRFRKGYAVTSLGSGVVVSPNGLVLTNNHVVERGTRFRVQLLDGRELAAKVVGTDPSGDLAVLKLQTEERMPYLPIGRSEDLMIGETVIAIGNPFGLANTVTTGVVSAVHRNFKNGDRTLFDFIQTDASINPGNSGGPLININGDLVGINTAILGDRNAGIGFAIPSDRARRVAEDLIQHGEVREGYLGVDVADPRTGGGHGQHGVAVVGVEPGSPAHVAGVRVGDVIDAVDGLPLESAEEYRFRVREVPIGGAARLELTRSGARRTVEVRAVELSLDRMDSFVTQRVGLELAERRVRGTPLLVAQRVRKGSPAAQAGLESGDLVREVNSREVSSLPEFRKAASRARRSGQLVLLVQRGFAAERVAFDLN